MTSLNNSQLNWKDITYNFFLTSRPYSYGGEIARAEVFALLLVHNCSLHDMIFSAVVTLLMWMYFNWQSDWIQKDPGRMNPSVFICFMPLVLALLLAFFQARWWGIAGISIYLFTILLYPLKTKFKNFGMLGPVFRMLTVQGHFLMIMAGLRRLPDRDTMIIVALVTVFIGIRNLVGDIRDIQTDKWNCRPGSESRLH